MSENTGTWGAIAAPPTFDETPEQHYQSLIAIGLSGAEAQGTAWPVSTVEEPKPAWIMPVVPDLETPVELPYATEGLTEDQIRALYIWENTKAQLTKLKAFEMEVRKAIVYDGGFFNEDVTTGTERVELGGGYELKSVKKETYNLDSDLVEAALENFTEDEAKLLVSWVANLSVTNYKKLTPEKQAFFNDCLDIKTGAPTLEIKTPKAKA